MLDNWSDLKIIEWNTIASSIGCLCDRLKSLHWYVVDQYEQDHISVDNFCDEKWVVDGLIKGMLKSWDMYFSGEDNTHSAMLVITEHRELGLSDKRIIIDDIYEKH